MAGLLYHRAAMKNLLLLSIFILVASFCANAQWLNYPESKTPRMKDGKPNLAAPAPRRDGKPDLSGVWHPVPSTKAEWESVLGAHGLELQIDLDLSSKYAINLLADFKPGEEPLRRAPGPPPKAENECLPDSLPFANYIAPFKIVQAPEQLVFMYESKSPARQVFLDGRPLPKDPQPSWMGYSVGKWSGDALTVESIGFRGDASLDGMGHPRSESARITERYRRRDFGHMDLETTVDDPFNYTRPFTVKVTLLLIPDTDVQEYVCAENERDRIHMDK
jgi:hypothetical protein